MSEQELIDLTGNVESLFMNVPQIKYKNETDWFVWISLPDLLLCVNSHMYAS